MADERRNDKRVRLPLEMRWEGMAGKHGARIYDISLNGCYIETFGQVATGERIRFEIQLPTGSWIQLQGEVVHFEPNVGFALRLLEVSDRDRDIVAQLIEYARNN